MFAEGFFKTTFGFEEVGYEETRNALLQAAEFSSTTTTSTFSASSSSSSDDRPLSLFPPLVPESESCILRNLPNGRTLHCGRFSSPSVTELRSLVEAELAAPGMVSKIQELMAKESTPLVSFKNIVGESFSMHCQNDYRGAVFQAASQFNYLEFPSPGVTPEKGINGYMHDRTQGPACAMACGAGTAYRNYLVNVTGAGDRGQRKEKQCDGLADATKYLMEVSQSEFPFFIVRNGYVESTAEKLDRLNSFLRGSSAAVGDVFSSKLRIGVQEDTQVTAPSAGKSYRRQTDGTWKEGSDESSTSAAAAFLVTQTYNAALSVGYSRVGEHAWEPLARLVLNGTYEATLLVGILQTLRNIKVSSSSSSTFGTSRSFVAPTLLTKVGGGVFGNRAEWIVDAMRRAVESVAPFGVPVDVRVVHFREIEQDYTPLEAELGMKKNVSKTAGGDGPSNSSTL